MICSFKYDEKAWILISVMVIITIPAMAYLPRLFDQYIK